MSQLQLKDIRMQSLLENCENVGISKEIIQKFVNCYLLESEDSNE